MTSRGAPRKLAMVAAIVLAFLILLLIVVGPWPASRSSGFAGRPSFRREVAEVRRQAATGSLSAGPLRAGWGGSRIAVPAGTPLAGYGERKGKPSTGEHDPLVVKAIALCSSPDGSAPTAVITSSDLLIVPANVARAVRRRVAAETDIRPETVIFTASHTHSGPGGSTRGMLARLFAGPFDPAVEAEVVDAFVRAICSARSVMLPARLTSGCLGAPELIRNRTRSSTSAPSLVDDGMDWLLFEQEGGARCFVLRFSAHATVLGASNMLLSGDFPGFLQRALEAETGSFVLYLGGALGSMAPRPPEVSRGTELSGDYARARAMGETLAGLVAEDARDLRSGDYQDTVLLRSVGLPITVPPLQLRIARDLVLSPVLLRIAGISRSAWFGALRIDEMLLVSVPADLSGEISAGWRQEALGRGLHALPLSFGGAYVGYLSPDAAYGGLFGEKGLAYETGIMSWCGPDQEAYFTALFREALDSL